MPPSDAYAASSPKEARAGSEDALLGSLLCFVLLKKSLIVPHQHLILELLNYVERNTYHDQQ